MKTIIFSDRDGTIINDENYYLGSNPDWEKQVSFLKGVIEGIKLINSIPDSHFFIVSNQAGVALQGPDFDNLTVDRVHEVNAYIIQELQKKGLKIDGYFVCPFVDSKYVAAAQKKGISVNPEFVHDNHPDIKPNTGMIDKALTKLNLTKDNCNIYMIGDRATDVEMGLRAGGLGILIENYKTLELHDRDKVAKMQGQTYIAKDFLDAARFIYERSK